MAEVTHGVHLEVTAEDQASAVVAKVGTRSTKALGAVKKFGTGAAASFQKIGTAAVMLNQAAELFKKFKDMGMIAIEMTREFVDANDPLMKSFDESSKTVKKLGANVGIVLIKAFNATVKALKPVIEAIQTWMVANQNLIGTKIVEWVAGFAKGAIVVLAKGILLVSKITSGWAMIWAALKIAVNTYYSALLKGTAKALEKMADFAHFLGMDGLEGKLRKASEATKDFGDTFKESADNARKELDEVIKSQEKFEALVKKYGQAAHDAIGVIAVSATKALNTETKVGNLTNEERNEILEAQKKKEEALEALRKKNRELRAAWAVKEKAFADAENARLEAMASKYGAIGSAIGGAFVTGFAAAEEGQDAVAAGFKSMTGQIIDTALAAMQDFVTIEAVKGAASAASNVVGIPIVGPAMAAIAAATAFALIRGFIGMAFMARGGMVEGGTPGHDTVPIMAQRGEMVLSRDQVDRMRQDGGLGGGGQVTIEMNSQIPAGRAEIKRFVRQNVVPALKDLRKQGMF